MQRDTIAISKGRFSKGRFMPILTGLALSFLALMPQVALAKLSTTVDGGTLTVSSDGADAITLTCQDGSVQINASQPDSGAVECATISYLLVRGGPGANTIDAAGVDSQEFSALAAVSIAGGAGNDIITGTTSADVIAGGPGNDRLAGYSGADSVTAGAGDDHLVWNNGDGSDTLAGDGGYDTLYVSGAAAEGDAFVIAPNGEGVVLTRTNLTPFILDIDATEKLVIEQGDDADTLQLTPLAQTQVLVSGGVSANSPASQPQPMVIVGAGDISNTIAAYQLLLGGKNNGGEPGSKPAGFRSISWDGVPDELAAPNDYPFDFFNAPTAPRARGAILGSPGDRLQVSADSDNPSGALPRFGHINPSYVDTFKTFSAERLFSPVGSNIADLTFFVPGTDTPAVTRGFGAVYTDIDTTHTAFEYFDINDNSLGEYRAPLSQDGLSFLGIIFPEPLVHRVRIHYGTTALGPDDGEDVDVAVMDDFIYGEPQAAVSGAAAAFVNSDDLPAAIRPDVALLVVAAPDTPQNIPYDPGMNAQAELALAHAQLALAALTAGDLAAGRVSGEQIWNILQGEKSYVFGDVNEDGQTQNPGDGYGILAYAQKSAQVADRIAKIPGLDPALHEAALGVALCARNVAGDWSAEVKKNLLALLAATDAADSVPAGEALVAALDTLTHGVDADGDGEIQAVKGECGAQQAYQLSHMLLTSAPAQ